MDFAIDMHCSKGKMQNFTSVDFGLAAVKFYNKVLVVKMAPQNDHSGAPNLSKIIYPTKHRDIFSKHWLSKKI